MAGKISNNLKTRLPARDGLGLNEFVDQAVHVDIAQRLFEKSGLSGELCKLKGIQSELEGYYRLKKGADQLFIKVLPEACLDQQAQANHFAEYVNKKGLLSSRLLADFPKNIGDGLVLFAYDWIEGRYLEPMPLELETFGRNLGELHRSLLMYPERKKVQEKTAVRLTILREVAEQMVGQIKVSTRYQNRLLVLLKKYPHVFLPFSEPCQVLHGDLNVGNVRLSQSGVVFLDFEDTIHSWLPRRIDVAFALERLALVNEPDNSRALENAKALLRGYVQANGSSPFTVEGSFSESLEWLSIRSLCMLQQFEWQGKPWPESEWLKFDRLLDHISERSDMLLEIETFFAR